MTQTPYEVKRVDPKTGEIEVITYSCIHEYLTKSLISAEIAIKDNNRIKSLGTIHRIQNILDPEFSWHKSDLQRAESRVEWLKKQEAKKSGQVA